MGEKRQTENGGGELAIIQRTNGCGGGAEDAHRPGCQHGLGNGSQVAMMQKESAGQRGLRDGATGSHVPSAGGKETDSCW